MRYFPITTILQVKADIKKFATLAILKHCDAAVSDHIHADNHIRVLVAGHKKLRLKMSPSL